MVFADEQPRGTGRAWEARLWAVNGQITQGLWTWGARAERTKPGIESLSSVERNAAIARWLVYSQGEGTSTGITGNEETRDREEHFIYRGGREKGEVGNSEYIPRT